MKPLRFNQSPKILLVIWSGKGKILLIPRLDALAPITYEQKIRGLMPVSRGGMGDDEAQNQSAESFFPGTSEGGSK